MIWQYVFVHDHDVDDTGTGTVHRDGAFRTRKHMHWFASRLLGFSNSAEPPQEDHSAFGFVAANLCMKYRTSQPFFVLNGLSFKLLPGEMCAVVGRTGAGKSSVAAAIFQLGEFMSGQIFLNNKLLNDPTTPRDVARKRVGIITQEPVLFTGSLRYNLDPFGEFKTAECRAALDEACLNSRPLNLPIKEGGSNLSLGEQQLVCLARALLRAPELLICDEATASIDLQTDRKVQNVLRGWLARRAEAGKPCCVLTIAHRLETIADYDKLLFMERGRALEFDSPVELLKHSESNFSQLVAMAGGEVEAAVRKLALEAEEARKTPRNSSRIVQETTRK